MEFQTLSDYVIEGNAKAALEWTQNALDEGVDPLEIVNSGLVPGMNVVGQKFKSEEYYLPEVLVSARAMKNSMALLKPLLAQREGSSVGRVVIGTVKGDLHDIGKNLVAMMLEGAGFEVIDVGIDVSPEGFLKAIEEKNPQIVAMSALLTTTMSAIKRTIDLLDEAEVRNKIKIMVGGAPVTKRFADLVGADGYAPEAATAVEEARELIKTAVA